MPSIPIRMNPSQQTSLQVLDTLDVLVRNWNRRDITNILSQADPGCSGFGPNSGDAFRGVDEFHAFLEREMENLKDFKLSGIRVEAIGTVSWVYGMFSCTGAGETQRAHGRITAVLKGTGHAWVFSHLHLSYPGVPSSGS